MKQEAIAVARKVRRDEYRGVMNTKQTIFQRSILRITDPTRGPMPIFSPGPLTNCDLEIPRFFFLCAQTDVSCIYTYMYILYSLFVL